MLFVNFEDFTPERRFEGPIADAEHEINVIVRSPNVSERDLELFFGPLLGSEFFMLVPENATWAHIFAKIGVFQSVAEGRKNGWNKQIDSGFTPRFKIGKKTRRFFTAFSPNEPGEGKPFNFERQSDLIGATVSDPRIRK